MKTAIFLYNVAVYDDVCVFVVDSGEEKSTLRSSTVIPNPTYENSTVCGNGTENTDDRKEDASYSALNKPTVVVQPVKRARGAKEDETVEANQYDVLNRTADEPLAKTPNKRSDAYDTLGVSTEASDKPRSVNPSDGGHFSPAADEDDNPYALPKDKDPNVSSRLRTTMPPAENEYSYAAPDVKRPIHASPVYATAGGDEYSVTEKQPQTQPSGYEEAVISAPNQPTGEGKGVYSVPDQERKISSGQSAVPAGTEYAYAGPDGKRSATISSDHVVIGPVVTAQRGKDGVVGNQDNDGYAVPDQVKAKKQSAEARPSNTDNVYASPDIQKAGSSGPDRIVMGKDEYAVSAKRITLPRAGQADKPAAKRVPSNPLQQSSSIAPERFSVNESEYAVSSKQSKNPKRDRDRGSDVQPKHYLSGEDQYYIYT